jgi:serine/threonine protein kinase
MIPCCYADKLQRFLDDEVGEGERADIERHLETCRHCQRELDQLTDLGVQDWPVPPLPCNGCAGGSVEPPPDVPGYRILGPLGRGGRGVVYLAYHERLRRHVALKMIRGGAEAGPTERARFRVEAQSMARLDHPNVIHIYEVGEPDAPPCFAMEYAPGGSLRDRVGDAPQPPDEAARLVQTLARAMH